MARLLNVEDYRRAARRRLPRGVFEFVDRGAEDEVALAGNRRAFEQIKLAPRVGIDVSARSAAAHFLGGAAELPLAIAPTGAAGLLWHHGELALAKAAAAAGVPFTLATGSLTPMEQIAAEAGGRLWFQLYVWKEIELSLELIARARAAGFEALVVTLDTPVSANREYNLRNGFALPFSLSPRAALDMAAHPVWFARVVGRYLAAGGLPRHENLPARYASGTAASRAGRSGLRSDSVTWDSIRIFRRHWPGKLVVKGVLHPDDAVAAAQAGADAVVVSNHGGRNLDCAVAPIDVLASIAQAVPDRVEVLLDGGVRRGGDIAKALTLGARAVLVGRPTLYGVAAGGTAGAAGVIALLKEELLRTMAQAGCVSVDDFGPNVLPAVSSARAALPPRAAE